MFTLQKEANEIVSTLDNTRLITKNIKYHFKIFIYLFIFILIISKHSYTDNFSIQLNDMDMKPLHIYQAYSFQVLERLKIGLEL